MYLRALTGQEHPPAVIDRFKSLLVELKYADWPMEQPMARVAGDHIGRTVLEVFLADSDEQPLFGELPRATLAERPASEARPSRLARLFRRN